MRSERMGRFLRFAVERTLDGKADQLKEYLIGVEVFDRKPSYDPRVDPIVRVEARRLRSKLAAYYAGDGREDPVLIEFATGSYAPRFQMRVVAPRATAPQPSINTIAVLPFASLGRGSEYEYFSDGLTEELIHALTKVEGLRVVAWNSATQIRGRQQEIYSVREQLHVASVLTGSVRIAGASLRVRAQLIDTETGVYLWSEAFDRHLQDIFAIQEEIASAIVRTLRLQFAGRVEEPVLARHRTGIDSYNYYLKGRYYWHQRTPEGIARSIECFEAAIAADPNSALAYAGLADGLTLRTDYGLLRPSEGMPKAKQAAMRALALDPNLAEAYPSMAIIRSHYDRDWEDAERLYRRAIALNPGYATAHHWLGLDHNALLGRFEEACAELELARQLDPLSRIIMEGCALVHVLNRQYEQAVEGYLALLKFDPSFYKVYNALGRAYAQQGRYQEALTMLQKGQELGGDVPNILGAMGQVYGLAGQTERARELLAKLNAMNEDGYIPSTCFALIHLGLGEKERSLEWLERGYEEHDMPLSVLKVHPAFDDLRGETRFRALLERLRLA
ncbi:MAG TPA: tetratricopeptide repeat protein [Bryobacteraceae bacterium]|nr:tetratricopeptide repeat protein [Bryobacteraceae bacterium]